MTISEINSAIIHGSFTNDQLSSIVMAVKYARTQMAKQNKRALKLGDSVKFVTRGDEKRGVVAKIMQKNVVVKVGLVNWKVPANMLEAA